MAKDMNDILKETLQDHENLAPDVDTSQGGIALINAAAFSSALWGLYNYLDYVLAQIFPDTATSALLERHAWTGAGMTRQIGETDEELLERYLAYKRQPPAGGNAADYEAWALEVDGVAAAVCIPCPQGAGTVDIVILTDSSTGSETPTQTLLDAVYAHIDALRPVTAGSFRVLAAQIVAQDVTMTASGLANKATAVAEIQTLLNSMSIGETLCLSALVYVVLTAGATDAVVSVPASNVTLTKYQVLRAGMVAVN